MKVCERIRIRMWVSCGCVAGSRLAVEDEAVRVLVRPLSGDADAVWWLRASLLPVTAQLSRAF